MIAMRLFFISALLGIASCCQAQSFFFPASLSYRPFTNLYQPFPQVDDSSTQLPTAKKWSLQTYKSVSVGMMMWKGGGASFISAPIGVQLNRRITDNVFAFAGASIAPTYLNFRQPFANSGLKNGGWQGMYQPNGLNLPARAEIGIGYVNDARTFQITGSIGVERNTYPYGGYAPVGNSNRNQMNVIR